MNDSVARRINAATPPPKFLMVGVEVPAGVRLYASRHMPQGLSFGQVEVNWETLWHVEGALSNMLVITKPTWNEALAELFAIWSGQDARERALSGQKPSAWKPVGGQRARSIPVDQPLRHDPYLHTDTPGITDDERRQIEREWPSDPDDDDPPYEYLRTTPRAELRIGDTGWSVQPGPDDQGEAEFMAGVLRDQRAGICGACGATWCIPEGGKLPEHTRGARRLGIRCDGSGELPVAWGLIGSGRSAVLYTIENRTGLSPVPETEMLVRQMKEAGLVVETFGKTTSIRLPVDSAMQYDLRKLRWRAHEIWDSTFPASRPADSTGEPGEAP